jgi:hypothetical protein
MMAVCVAMSQFDYMKSNCWGVGHNLRGKTCVERLWISVKQQLLAMHKKEAGGLDHTSHVMAVTGNTADRVYSYQHHAEGF